MVKPILQAPMKMSMSLSPTSTTEIDRPTSMTSISCIKTEFRMKWMIGTNGG